MYGKEGIGLGETLQHEKCGRRTKDDSHGAWWGGGARWEQPATPDASGSAQCIGRQTETMEVHGWLCGMRRGGALGGCGGCGCGMCWRT